MFMVPGWIASTLFLITCYISGFQHTKLARRNPILNIQFIMMAFSLVMILLNVMYSYESPWVALGFLLVAVGSLSLMIHQFRRMPATLPTV
jgi:hypothetical protein